MITNRFPVLWREVLRLQGHVTLYKKSCSVVLHSTERIIQISVHQLCCTIHTLCGNVEPSSYSSGYGQPAASHPGYQPPAHPVSQQYQTSTSQQPASGSAKYPQSTIASPSAFSSFPAMSAGYGYQQPGSKPPALTAEQYASYIRPQSLPRHHTPQSGRTADCLP